MKKKLLTILLCLTISGTLLAGCQSTTDSSAAETTNASTAAASSAATEAAAKGDTIIGQVTSVDGNTITLALGEMKERPSNGGTPPEEMSEPASGDMPEPSSDGMPEPSSDGMSDNQAPPDNNGGGPGGINLTGEEKTITIDDSTELLSRGKGESTAAALEDIATDSVLTVVMDGDTVKTITISGFGNGSRQGKNKNDSSSKTNELSDTEISTDEDSSDTV